MNKIIAVITIVFAFTLGTIFSADIATAAKPVTEVFVTNTEPIEVTGLVSSSPACPAENVQHWMNVRATTSIDLIHSSEPTIPVGAFFLPITTSGSEIFPFDGSTQFVVNRLTELGYTTPNGNPVITQQVSLDFSADSVGYSTICAEN